MTAKTPAKRKADERERMRSLGFKPAQVWVHVDDWQRLRAYADKLMKARRPHNSQGDRG